jgi:hypothetical protein
MPQSGQQQSTSPVQTGVSSILLTNQSPTPDSKPKKSRKWLKWLGIILLITAILIIATPYLFALGLVISLKEAKPANNVWNELWTVPQEHVLAPMPDQGSGQAFTVGSLTFESPISDTTIEKVFPDGGETEYVAGNKSFYIDYNSPPGTTVVASAIISLSDLGTSTIMDSNGKIESEYQLWLAFDSITPKTVFNTPNQTFKNIALLKTKAIATSPLNSPPLLVSHTQYIDSISQLSNSGPTIGSVDIFDKKGNNISHVVSKGLTQGELDALISSIQVAATSSDSI